MKRLNLLMFFALLFLCFNISCSDEQDLFQTIQEVSGTETEEGTGETSEDNDNSGNTENDGDTGNTGNDNDYGELKAFPTAFGAGASASGGRGGKVIRVTNLNSEGSGSFREALNSSGPRTVIFDVSGNIDLQGRDIYLSGSTKGDLTIAGQTAPRGGITFTNGTIYFEGVDNIIIRYLRGRPAQAVNGEVSQGDAFIFWGCNDVILDHISISFGGDQAMTFNSGTKTMRRITVQRSLIADSYTGVIMGANNPDRYKDVDGVSFLNNLIVDMPHRTPNFSGDGYFESVNNVVYNWLNRAVNVNGGNAKVNHLNNYHKRGRTTERNTIAYNSNKIQIPNSRTAPLVHTSGNYYQPVITNSGDDNTVIWTNFRDSSQLPSQYFTSEIYPLLGAPVPMESATQAYNDVLSDVGANRFIADDLTSQMYLDNYDDTKINNVINDVSTVQRNYSNWVIPNLPSSTRSSNFDTDLDGMPDLWEISVGLNPRNAEDGNRDRNNDGYTNLEDYLNLVDFR